jgi:hypothetical protein
MKNILLVLAGVLIGVVALGVVGFAYAQVQTPPDAEFPQGYGPGMMGRSGRGMMGAYGAGMMRDGSYGPMHTYMVDGFAAALGLTTEDLQAKIDAGETMAGRPLKSEEISALMLAREALQRLLMRGPTKQQIDESHMQQSGIVLAPAAGGATDGWQRGPGWRWNTAPES